MICGVNPYADALLTMLVLEKIPRDVYRFRDVYMPDEETVGLVCRVGGRNRRNYQEIITLFQSHPCYIRDEDNDFDSTFLTIYFSVPSYYEAFGRAVFGLTDREHPLDKFQRIVNDMSDGVDNEHTERMLQVGQELMGKILSGSEGEVSNEDGAVTIKSLSAEEAQRKIREGWTPVVVDTDDASILEDMGYEIDIQED
jgi:hypothetical protein